MDIISKFLSKYVAAIVVLPLSLNANAIDLTVQDENGALINGYKWVLEEDQTSTVIPGLSAFESISMTFHNSYSPVLDSGECTSTPCVITPPDPDPTKRYFISVLPFGNYSLGSASVGIGATNVTAKVHSEPTPTAQITVRVFHDIHPINGAPDDPEEQLAIMPNVQDFKVFVEEAGGRYGHTGGQVILDAYGNPLGSTYDAAGNLLVAGDGFVHPGPDGNVTIKNLPPAKYGVFVVPPSGQNWVQTSTIEGTQVIDAWVKANEPAFFAEFGPPGPHVFIGFIQPFDNLAFEPTPAAGRGTISGTIVSNRIARPPEVGFFPGATVGGCWVGINKTAAAGGAAIYAQPCDGDSNFSIPNVPAGTYDLVIWDDNLDYVIAQRTFTHGPTMNDPANPVGLNLGNVPVFSWFNRFESNVFYDDDEDGFMDVNEVGIPEQAVNLRFRNGTVYQSFPTDLGGAAPFDEVFPFFHWLVAEVDFARFKATGATYVVDNGGDANLVDAGLSTPTLGILNPQPQGVLNPHTNNDLATTLTGPVLTLGYQGFLGMTNRIDWGKTNYTTADVDLAPANPNAANTFPGPEDTDHDGDGEFDHGNGGLSGLVLYAITRAEDDPRYAAGEEWEPGIARVQLNLYQDFDNDDVIDDLDQSGDITLADVDNYPLGDFPGPGDIDNGTPGVFDYGDAAQVTWTDSWDDNLPTGCKGTPFVANPGTSIENTLDCFDGLRTFNQIREGVFDGGYAFDGRIARDAAGAPTGDELQGLLEGFYIVETTVPNGYVLLKEEDKNVDFGEEYTVPALLPPVCVGNPHTVPQYLSFQTDETGALLPDYVSDPIESPFYDPTGVATRPLCDRKKISLTAGKNAAADFFLFTDVPIGAHVVGGVLNDLANEFDPNNPNFGEKFSPPWVPVTFRDWTGAEIKKTYTDEFGKFEAVVPSTYTVNIPSPTGISPNMLQACMNDPSPITNPNYDPADPSSSLFINDPYYNPQFSTFCYTFQYMPGSTTYLDTPVVPVAAFAGTGQFPVDCEAPDFTPVVSFASASGQGPVFPVGTALSQGRNIEIFSEGLKQVPNHLFGNPGELSTVTRDYGFGDVQGAGVVEMDGVALPVVSWTDAKIIATVPVGTPSGQLTVTASNGVTSPRGIYVTTDLPESRIHRVTASTVAGATPIQDAIDLAADGDMILVGAGTFNELVIMDHPVQMQGWGAGLSKITAVRTPTEKLANWRSEIDARLLATDYDLLPGQDGFDAEEGPGIIVVGKATGNFNAASNPRIDGLQISGAVQGGGIFVNGYIHDMIISNNRLLFNAGFFSGGLRVGSPTLTTQAGNNNLVHTDSDNDNLIVRYNQILQNGSMMDAGGNAGGGISLYTGTDNYEVSNNYICGNFSQGDGGGIGHLGFSDNGVIENNTIAYNQSFNQGFNRHGGGVYIAGKAGLENRPTTGSGNVTIEGNVIQGNISGAGHGGGIFLSQINGQDVVDNPADDTMWNGVDIIDNIIANNVAGWTGAGIGLQDAAKVRIVHNTIAHNDATATVGNVFDSVTNTSTAQPGAGIISLGHNGALATASGQTFSDPLLDNNIIWENRTFSWEVILSPGNPAQFGLLPDIAGGQPPVFSDLGVLAAGSLNPTNSILTDVTGTDPSNVSVEPSFVLDYFNGDRGQTVIQNEQSVVINIGTAAALDEGGNFVDVHFGPLSLTGNYHLRPDSPAIDAGSLAVTAVIPGLADDIDGDARPNGTDVDIGADELTAATAADLDADGIQNVFDNCVSVDNGSQLDVDTDGFGNSCDADLNNDGNTNALDIGLMRTAFANNDPILDVNGDGVVNIIDIGLVRPLLFKPPGPSGLAQ